MPSSWRSQTGAQPHDRGYATEAAFLVRDWAWRWLQLPRLVSIIQLGNDRSVRSAEKLGGHFEREITT
jgi:RimJ/RimL family protein N-acetyltransferase